LIVAAFLFYIDRQNERRDKAEKERFREFVIAAKSKNTEEYAYHMPTEGDLPKEEEDELVELDQVPPETLFRAIKEHENN